MKLLPKIAIPILMLGVASSLGANPVKQFQQQQNVYVKQRRFVEDNGYPVQAVAVDVRGAPYPYIYQRNAVGDAVAEEEINQQLINHENRIAALEKRIEDLIRILSGGEGGNAPDGGNGGAGVDELTVQFTAITKENCQKCHSPKNSEGDLTFFNDKGDLWVKKTDGDQPRNLTAREWYKVGRYVEIGKMPKGDKKLNNEQKDLVAEYVDKQLEILEGNK